MKYKPNIVSAAFRAKGIPAPEYEYRFDPVRRWRFDLLPKMVYASRWLWPENIYQFLVGLVVRFIGNGGPIRCFAATSVPLGTGEIETANSLFSDAFFAIRSFQGRTASSGIVLRNVVRRESHCSGKVKGLEVQGNIGASERNSYHENYAFFAVLSFIVPRHKFAGVESFAATLAGFAL